MNNKEEILATIRTHKKELRELGIRKVGLFGSYVQDKKSPRDIDILIEFQEGQENYDDYLKACDILERLFKGKKVDIVTKKGLSPYIGPQILEEVMYA